MLRLILQPGLHAMQSLGNFFERKSRVLSEQVGEIRGLKGLFHLVDGAVDLRRMSFEELSELLRGELAVGRPGV